MTEEPKDTQKLDNDAQKLLYSYKSQKSAGSDSQLLKIEPERRRWFILLGFSLLKYQPYSSFPHSLLT